MKEEIARVIEQEVLANLPQVIKFRHERHQYPELAWQEEKTAEAVAKALHAIPGIKVQENVARFGVVGLIEGDAPGPTIALRADMDALAIHEVSACSYRSKRDGLMHACGHDGHMANLFGAAIVLAKMRKTLKGRVKLIFQPAEEGGAGAQALCEAGVLKSPDVDVIFGLHGWPSLPVGKIFVRHGAMLASTATIKLRVEGVGCHAAMPHLGTDQILVAARMIDALQMIPSRFVAPTEAIALSITKIQGGSSHNIIPSSVEMLGTLRTLSQASFEKVSAQMHRIISGLAMAHGVKADLEILPGYPATINHEKPTAFFSQIAKQVLGEENVLSMPEPTMGGEDFAYYLQEVPGSFFFLGVDDGRQGGYPSLHHPAYDFNDAALSIGIKLFVNACLEYSNHNRLI